MRAEAPNGLPRALGLTLTVTFLPPRAWHHAASSTLVPPLRPRGTAGAPEARTPSPGLRPDGPRPRALELPPLRGGRARHVPPWKYSREFTGLDPSLLFLAHG